MEARMQEEGQGQTQAHGQGVKSDQVKSWFNDAPPSDVVTGTIAGLKRIAMFDQTYRGKFLAEIQSDQTVARLLEDLKTPA
jgi:hypothetical protein